MERNNFYEFTRPVQERFIGSVNGTGMPTPVLERRGGPQLPFWWLGISVAGFVLVVVLFPLGLGVLESPMAIQSVAFLALYIAGIAATVLGVMMTMAAWREVRALPFRPGVYVFPVGVVDARTYILKVHPLSEIAKVDTTARELVIGLQNGATYSFPYPTSEDVQNAASKLEAARSHLKDASAAPESMRPGALAGIDPFHGAASPFVPNKPLLRSVPLWARMPWVFAAAAGIVVGLTIFAFRNRLGDKRLYASALEQNDVEGYKAYLARGSRYKDDVEKTRLPRAELRIAEKASSVEAIEDYIRSHQGSAIPDEIAAARRTALLQELERAKQAKTVSSLKDFDAKFKQHGLDPELKKAIHAVYVAAIDRYKREFAPKDPEAVRFVEQIVAFAEQKGPKVEVRFKRKPSKTVEKADGLISKSKFFMGSQSFPSKYFDAAHLAPREGDTSTAVAARFAEAFPKDIITVSSGELVTDLEGPLPTPTVPTLFIEHQVEWAGGVLTSPAPRGVFVGLGFLFESTFRTPNDPKPIKVKAADWRAPDPSNLKGEAKPEEKLYGDMAKNCFDAFTKKVVNSLFRPPPAAANNK